MKIGIQALTITDEHGSWVVLFVPMVTGILSTKIFSVDIIPLFFLILFSFMLYKPAEIMYRQWSSIRMKNQKYQNALISFFIYGFFATGLLFYEMFYLQKFLLLVFGTAAVVIFILSIIIKDPGNLSFLREFLGVTILTSTAPVSARTLLKKGDYPYWKDPPFTDAKDFQPQIVIIKLGTNDTKSQNWVYKNEFYSDYIDLINEFRKGNVRPQKHKQTFQPRMQLTVTLQRHGKAKMNLPHGFISILKN